MYSKLLYVLLFISLGLFAQEEKALDTLSVTITPSTSKRIVLYSAEGAQQKYIAYVDSETGAFKLPIPSNQSKGMYRLVFDQKTMNYIDFLYLGKSLSIQFDPTKPDKNLTFEDSNANTRYYKYLNTIREKQQVMDSLQVVYFQTDDETELKKLKKSYLNNQNLFTTYLKDFDEKETHALVKDLIKANVRVQPNEPIKNPEKYLPFIKEHYFDSLDFNNENLIHSSVLVDKVMDFVFYLTVSRDPDTQNKLYKEAVSNVLNRIDNQQYRAGFTQALIQSFGKEENITLTDFLFDNFYNKLDLNFQNKEFRTNVQKELKAAIGRKASNFGWKEEKKIVKLWDLEDFDNYIVVFWSSSCPHCLKEIPKLHEYTKGNKKVKVIAVGIETEESKNAWKSETYYTPNLTHVLGLGKWENPIARAYNVFSTPNYFVLDSDKKIISKPYELVDLKVFFKGLEAKQVLEESTKPEEEESNKK